MTWQREGESYVFSRVVEAIRDVAEVEMNCNRVADTDPTIAFRSNWSCLSQRIWSKLGEEDATSGRVIIARGHSFDPSTKPSKSYPSRKDENWSRQAG